MLEIESRDDKAIFNQCNLIFTVDKPITVGMSANNDVGAIIISNGNHLQQ